MEVQHVSQKHKMRSFHSLIILQSLHTAIMHVAITLLLGYRAFRFTIGLVTIGLGA